MVKIYDNGKDFMKNPVSVHLYESLGFKYGKSQGEYRPK